MKRKNQLNCFESKGMSVFVFDFLFDFFFPNMKQSQEKKLLFTLFYAFGHQRTVIITLKLYNCI